MYAATYQNLTQATVISYGNPVDTVHGNSAEDIRLKLE